MSRQAKIRWGDTLDDDDALPRSQTKGPDEHGNKTIIEYYRNDKGDAIKKTTKIKVMNIEKKTYNVSCRWGALAGTAGRAPACAAPLGPAAPLRHCARRRRCELQRGSARGPSQPAGARTALPGATQPSSRRCRAPPAPRPGRAAPASGVRPVSGARRAPRRAAHGLPGPQPRAIAGHSGAPDLEALRRSSQGDAGRADHDAGE
jgi:hypothetical protein